MAGPPARRRDRGPHHVGPTSALSAADEDRRASGRARRGAHRVEDETAQGAPARAALPTDRGQTRRGSAPRPARKAPEWQEQQQPPDPGQRCGAPGRSRGPAFTRHDACYTAIKPGSEPSRAARARNAVPASAASAQVSLQVAGDHQTLGRRADAMISWASPRLHRKDGSSRARPSAAHPSLRRNDGRRAAVRDHRGDRRRARRAGNWPELGLMR